MPPLAQLQSACQRQGEGERLAERDWRIHSSLIKDPPFFVAIIGVNLHISNTLILDRSHAL